MEPFTSGQNAVTTSLAPVPKVYIPAIINAVLVCVGAIIAIFTPVDFTPILVLAGSTLVNLIFGYLAPKTK